MSGVETGEVMAKRAGFSRRAIIKGATLAMATGFFAGRARAKTALTVGAIQFGTAHWLFDVIKERKLDEAQGFALSVRMLSSNAAALIALLGREADIVVSDWFWVMRQRSLGGDYLFMPYLATLGGVILPETSSIGSVADLKGKSIGVAGGPIDKSWLLLRAYGSNHGAGDLAATARPVFAAPPILNEQAEAGRLDALLNYWPFAARLEAKGYRTLISVHDLMRALGIATPLPLVGFVFDANLARGEPRLMQAFAKAVVEAQNILRTSDEEWERIRRLMKASSEAEFRLLRDRYRDGLLKSWGQADREAAARLFEIVRETGAEEVTGAGVRFDAKAFWDGFVL
jgi:NitT/TauT family transport system substrate-binding protein